MKKGISLVIPCYNNGRFINELYKSIINANIRNDFEVIIIDDCSDDKSYINELKNTDIIFVQNSENKGVQYSRNLGLSLAKFEYIMMIDADDKLAPPIENMNFIDYSIDLLSQNSDICFVHGLVEMFDSYTGYTISAYPINAEMIAHKHHVQTSIIYRTQDGRDCGGYSESIKKWQDWSFGVALLNYRITNHYGTKVGFWNGTSYLYRIHQETRISQSIISEESMISETIRLYPAFFNFFYPKKNSKEITEILMKSKPSRLLDLLYVANNNLDRAKQIMCRRNYFVTNEEIGDNIP